MYTKEKSNPFLYLFAKAWHYAANHRRRMIMFWVMFVICESIHLFGQPFIWAQMMNTVQVSGIEEGSIKTLLLLLGLSILLEIVFWAFHGPARYLEEIVAFQIRTNYRRHLLRGVMTLPLEWHTDHHSGDIIDKIEKGTAGLYEFSQTTFQVIYGIVRLSGSLLILTYFSVPAGLVVAVMIVLAGWITVRFDRVLVTHYHEINQAENRISESVVDAVYNISTVIILRVEKLVFDAIVHKVMRPFGVLKKNTIANEWKWFLTNMCCAFMTAAVLAVYFFQNLGTKEGVLVGSVYLLVQYLSQVSEQFYQFTMMYGSILRRKARVMNAENLSADFTAESFANHVLPKTWKELKIGGLNF